MFKNKSLIIQISSEIWYIMMNISDKIFYLTLLVFVALMLIMIMQKPWDIDPSNIGYLETVFGFLAGALIGTYIQKGEKNE